MPIERLVAGAITSDGTFWSLGGGTDGAVLNSDDGDTSYARCSQTADIERYALSSLPASAGVVTNVDVTRWVATREGAVNRAARVGFYLAGSYSMGATRAINGVSYSIINSELGIPKPGGGVWSVADINNSELVVETTNSPANSPIRITCVFVDVTWEVAPAQVGAALVRGSAEIHLRRSALPTIVGRHGLLALDRELLAHAAWQHYAGTNVKDAGWGIRPWERRLGALISSDFDMDALEVTVTDFDLRRFLVSFRDTMSSDEVPSAQYQGVLRLDPGAGRVFVRAETTAYIENPSAALQGFTQLVRIGADQEKLSIMGPETIELIEPARTNSALRSSYFNGLTGITTAGASTITADTTVAKLLFEALESPNSLKFTAGNPHGTDGTAAHPVTAAFAANDRIVVSYYHMDDGGEALAIHIQKSGGGSDYWNDSTGAWAAGPINNSMPVSSTRYARWISKVIDVGTGTPTITATIVQPSGGTVSRVNRGGHLQIELGRSATSPILTTTVAVARAADNLKIENFTGKVVYDPARLSGAVDVVPNFNSADLAAGDVQNILRAYKDANNYDVLFYWVGTGFVFRRVVGGVIFDASKAQVVTRGTPYKIGFRATGTDAEEDLAAYTISVFVNGVKGTDAVPGGAWTPGPAEYLYIGQNIAGASLLDGGIRQLVIRPFVLADDEMVDQP